MIHFLAGLPRSGSTLLANLLAQNPACHATATNDLIELVVAVRNQWPACEGFRAQGLEYVQPRIVRALAGLVRGFYAEELAAGRTVFDKSRGWPAYIELMEAVLGREVRVVVTIRDVRDVVASFEKLHRRSTLMRPDAPRPAYFDCQTVEGRAAQLLAPDAVLGLAIRRVLDAWDRGLRDRLVVVPYRDLTERPAATLLMLTDVLGLEPWDYDFDAVEPRIPEDDSVWGFPGLHTVRTRVEPQAAPAWEGILPGRLAAQLDRDHADVQRLAGIPPPDPGGPHLPFPVPGTMPLAHAPGS